MPSRYTSPAWPSEKPRRRTSSSPVSPAIKVTPAVVLSTSRKLSRLRSSSSCSVITVTFCGMSRSDCWPLPMLVWVARSVFLFLISGGSACSVTVTVLSVPPDGVWAGAVCAMAVKEPASNSAPNGNTGVEMAVAWAALCRRGGVRRFMRSSPKRRGFWLASTTGRCGWLLLKSYHK